MSSLLRGAKRIFRNPFKSKPTGPEAEKAASEAAAAAAAKPPKVKLSTRASNYVKGVMRDYKEVGKDTLKTMNDKPFKSLGYGLFISSMLIFYKKNPTKMDYDAKRLEMHNELIMCGPTHSNRSEYYLNEISKLDNLGLIEYRSFLFFSLILVRKFTEADCNYDKLCAQLNNPNKFNIFNSFNIFLRFISRIIDIGYCDQWHFLNKYLKDYDVLEKEWVSIVKK